MRADAGRSPAALEQDPACARDPILARDAPDASGSAVLDLGPLKGELEPKLRGLGGGARLASFVVGFPGDDAAGAKAAAGPTFRLKGPTSIEILLIDRKGGEQQEVDFELDFPDGEKRRGRTSGGGWVRETRPGPVEKVKVRWDPPGVRGPIEREVWIDVGDLASEEGAKRRLHNLGYNVADIHAAVREFELDTGLPVDGEFDDEMRRALEEQHDRGGFAKPAAGGAEPSGGGQDEKADSGDVVEEHPPLEVHAVEARMSAQDIEQLIEAAPRKRRR